MATAVSNQPSVNIYACGGGGINVTAELESHRGATTPGFAQFNSYYIDTSRSNLSYKSIQPDCIYLFESVDGSGKKRRENAELISKNTRAILQCFKPSAFNIVIHTASGGSGSVIGPALVSELKARGERVIVIVIGSTDTRIEIENTIKTRKSYEAIAQLRQSPVIVHYAENSRLKSRFIVNKEVKYAVSLLLGLFSGQNEELDSADLTSWMEFLPFTGGHPQLSALNFVLSLDDVKSVGNATSVATLALPDMDTRLGDAIPAYQCVGYAPLRWRVGTPESAQMIKDTPLHYVISADYSVRTDAALATALREADAAMASQNPRESLLRSTDTATENGLVL